MELSLLTWPQPWLAAEAAVHNSSVQALKGGHLDGAGLCRYCGTRSGLTVDHVVPLSKGGKWVWENLVTACSKCNGKKGSKSLKQLVWTLKQRPKARCAAPQLSLRILLRRMLAMPHRSLSVVGAHVLT